ncbi:hypothetical protein ES703_20466 [subsurface metagenome]
MANPCNIVAASVAPGFRLCFIDNRFFVREDGQRLSRNPGDPVALCLFRVKIIFEFNYTAVSQNRFDTLGIVSDITIFKRMGTG